MMARRSVFVVVGIISVALLGLMVCGASLAAQRPSSASNPNPTPGQEFALDKTSQSNSVTYVANAGFLIWVGDKKVLIDAIFAGY